MGGCSPRCGKCQKSRQLYIYLDISHTCEQPRRLGVCDAPCAANSWRLHWRLQGVDYSFDLLRLLGAYGPLANGFANIFATVSGRFKSNAYFCKWGPHSATSSANYRVAFILLIGCTAALRKNLSNNAPQTIRKLLFRKMGPHWATSSANYTVAFILLFA